MPGNRSCSIASEKFKGVVFIIQAEAAFFSLCNSFRLSASHYMMHRGDLCWLHYLYRTVLPMECLCSAVHKKHQVVITLCANIGNFKGPQQTLQCTEH